MSFILDALKKSESERQNKRAAAISDVPVASSRRVTGRWLWLIGALLAVNALVLTALLLRPTEPQAIGTQAPPEPEPAAARATTEPPALQATLARAPDSAAARKPDPEPEPEPEQKPAAPVATQEPGAAPVAVAPAPARPQPRPTETLLTFQEARARGAVDIPDLHIDLHVFSESPADRFVFINMNQYRESSVLSEGPELLEITPEGVVLEYRGTTFLLARD